MGPSIRDVFVEATPPPQLGGSKKLSLYSLSDEHGISVCMASSRDQALRLLASDRAIASGAVRPQEVREHPTGTVHTQARGRLIDV
jgi:hypothetical protein